MKQPLFAAGCSSQVLLRCYFSHSSKLSKASVTKIKYKISTYKFSCVIKALALQVQKQQPDRQYSGSTLQKKKKKKRWMAKKPQATLHCTLRQRSGHFSKSRGRHSDINHHGENSHCSLQLSREGKKKKQTECQATRTSARSNHINCFSGWT